MLELGAGDGRLVARLRAAGIDARGVERSAGARRAARARGIALAPTSPIVAPADPILGQGPETAVAQAGSQDRGEDAIVLWHLLEHLPDPASVLTAARGALAPGGELVVGVPNLASLQAGIGGDRWFHQDVPRHRTHFTAAGLAALLARCGLRPRRVSHLLVEQNPLGMWQTLLNLLTGERNVAFRLLKRDLSLRGTRPKLDLAITAVAALPLALAAVPLELAAGLARRGGTIVSVATRDELPALEPPAGEGEG